MSILNGTGTTQPKEIWYGNNKIKEVWVGNNKVWPTGPQFDAIYWFDFNDSSAVLKNRGTSPQPLAVTGTYPVGDYDHVIFEANTRVSVPPPTGWLNGYTTSMWVRDTAFNSGWKTFLHRAPSTGWAKETYVVLETNTTTTSVVSGLRFPPTHREYRANYSFPVSSDWTHIVVVWARTSSTTFQCRFYINGVARGAFNGSGYLAGDQFTSENLFIGGNRDAGEWSGRLDDFLLWDRPLSAAEVTELYNPGRSWIPRITTVPPLSFAVGEPGSMLLATNFGATTWTVTGSMPTGLVLYASGLLTGTPTTVGSGVMTITASSDLYSVTKAIAWEVIAVPNTVLHTIKARSANKVSHSGWNKPALTWDLVTNGSATSTNSGEIIVKYGRGRVRAQPAMVNTRKTRVVSSVRGVMASGGLGNADYYSPTVVFQEGERIHLEVENFSSNTNDQISLSVTPPP